MDFFSKEKFDQLAAWVADLEKLGEIEVVTIRQGIAVPLPSGFLLFSTGLTLFGINYLRRRLFNRPEDTQ
jgi:hypothetical protein